MTIAVAKKYWTDEELLALTSNGRDGEIIDGQMIVMSPANGFHGRSIGKLFKALGSFVDSHRLGEMLDGQTGFRMQDGSVLMPDISFVSNDAWRAYTESSETFLQRSAELVVEVLSPSDSFEHIDRKLELYFANGTQLAWIVNPRSQTVHVHRGRIAKRILTATESLDGEDVLPGFAFPIADMF
jgi:Uma2 family endonuclease